MFLASPRPHLQLLTHPLTKKHLLLGLLWLGDWLLKNLKDLLVSDLLVGLVLRGIEGWSSGELGNAVLGDG